MGDAAVRPWKRYSGWPTRDTASFNTLADPRRFAAGAEEPRKLDGPITGDPAIGAKLVVDRTRGGSCLACHVMGQAGRTPTCRAMSGPDLSEIGKAGLKDEDVVQFRLRRPRLPRRDRHAAVGHNGLFSDAEIGHIVAFLKTLNKPAVFRTEVDDPSKRPPPVETRDNLDESGEPGPVDG